MPGFNDIDTYFNTGLETDAVLTTVSGSSDVKVHYRNPYQAAKLLQDKGFDVDSTEPFAIIRTSEISAAKSSDSLTIGGKAMRIVSIEINKEGEGISVLKLSFG